MGYAILMRRKLFSQRSRKGQGLLESAITLVLMVALLFGIMKIWIWGNQQIVTRQIHYNEGRVAAGTASDGYTLQWPVSSGGSLEGTGVIRRAR